MAFTTKRVYEIKLVSGGDKLINVRFPTDAELIERARKLVTISRHGGRGAINSELKNLGEVEQQLVSKIRGEGETQEISEGEAIYIVDRLLQAAVQGVTREGDTFRVTLKVPKGTVTHVLRIPTLDQARKFSKSRTAASMLRHHSESRTNLEPVVAFWDSIKVGVEGYDADSDIPVTHKDEAIGELIAQIHMAMEDDDPEI